MTLGRSKFACPGDCRQVDLRVAMSKGSSPRLRKTVVSFPANLAPAGSTKPASAKPPSERRPEGRNSLMTMPANSTEPSTPTITPRVGSDSTRQPAADDHNNNHNSLPPLVSLGDLVLEAPAWLFSAAIHMFAVIVLGLLFIVPERPFELLLRLDEQDGFEELSGNEFDLDLDMVEESADAARDAEELVTLADLQEFASVLIEPTEVISTSNMALLALDSESVVVSAPIQLALSGRSQGMQQKLLDAYGGTAQTQRAVMMALRWLERYQGSQGMWSLRGKYQGGGHIENREAATGLALLAFQGAGYTPQGTLTQINGAQINGAQANGAQHDFTKVTSRAWKSLLRQQNETGDFFQEGRSATSQLYSQAICTIALCELYGMTKDSRYREPAQRAIDYCVRIQASEGGWRYNPGGSSDLSVTGWFAMAMQSARMAGLEVPTPTLQRISGYLDLVGSQEGVFYNYRPNNQPTASMTAEGLLCRQYLGWSQSDPRLRRGAQYLTNNLPTWERGERDVYYWYYATQVCHHMEGKYWRKWNDAMKVVLPNNQVQEGRERGSWHPTGDEWGNSAGRLYVTCLSTFMLEVYYRHLPIYQMDALSGGL